MEDKRKINKKVRQVIQKLRTLQNLSETTAAAIDLDSVLASLDSEADIAIMNASLREDLEQKVQTLHGLSEIEAKMIAAPDLPKVLKLIVQHAVETIGADSSTIHLYDEGSDELGLAAWAGKIGDDFLQKHPPRPDGIGREAIRGKRPVTIDDPEELRQNNLSIYQEGVRAIASFPLIAADRAVGVLYIHFWREAHTFTQAEVDLITLFANQAAIAMENARLFEQEQRRAREAETMVEVGKALSSTLDLDKVLQKITDGARHLTGTDTSSILLVDEKNGDFTPAGRSPPLKEPPQTYPRKSGGFTRLIVETGEPVIVTDTRQRRKPKVRLSVIEEGVLSFMGVPLRIEDRTIGVLFVNSYSQRQFTEYEVNLLSSLASQAAIVIENVRLFQSAQDRIKELNLLREVGQDITGRIELREVLSSIVKSANRVIGSDISVIYPYDTKKGEFLLDLVAADGQKKALRLSERLSTDGIRHKIMEAESGWTIVEDLDEQHKMGSDFTKREKVRAFAGVVLRVGDEVIGILFVNFRAPHEFGDDERRAIGLFANQAAIAIQNARLYENLEREVEERTQELKTAYEELKDAQEQMLAAERWAVLGKAAVGLAHRINNTVGLIPVITQDLGELLADVALEEERRQAIDADLQRIERNTRFTLQMADTLFKPFEVLPTEECDVNALLEESISVTDVPEDVALKTKYADELPKVMASRVLADVFVELITNAAKTMSDGGELEVGSRLGREGWVEVWFSDTGHGIPPENQDKIFDLFFTTSEDSLGFGLWWVKTFLLQQGATIDVESEVGKGTTFTVSLPVEGPQAAGG